MPIAADFLMVKPGPAVRDARHIIAVINGFAGVVNELIQDKVKVKVSTLDIALLRGTPPQKRSGTDHTVLPANFTVPASTS